MGQQTKGPAHDTDSFDEGFRTLAEAAPDAIVVTQDGRFVFANTAAARLHGYERPDEILGCAFADLVAAEDLRSFASHIATVLALASPHHHRWECRALHRDGSRIAISVCSSRITFAGEPAVLCFGQDVTVRKQLEGKLMSTDRMAAMGTLAAGVAHEINNPLTYVLLNLRRLRRSLPSFIGTTSERELCERLLDEALDGSERVRLIVKDLLELGRPQVLDIGPTQVTSVVESAVKLAHTSLHHRAQIIRHYRPTPPVLANDARLGQVFLNLLINAGQAFRENDPRNNEIRITVSPHGPDKVIVDVADNGAGIPAASAERIFDPFFTTKPVGTGVGLGLPIARSIVNSLSGELSILPSDSGGVFRIELPSHAGATEARPENRVLVVDDNGPLAHQLDVILARGCEVLALTDSRRALALAAGEPKFAAVCCDLDRAAGLTLFSRACEAAPAMVKRMVLLASPTSAALSEAEAHGSTVLIRPLSSHHLDAALSALL